MAVAKHIRYLRHKEIDKNKWDRCIDRDPTGLIYATSIYLDTMSANWDALVMNDYNTIMPLPWKKKFGIKYIYQPFLTAQLGVFGEDNDVETIDTFINAIPAHFKLVEISLNSSNHPESLKEVINRTNYVLPLKKSYNELYSQFNSNTHRNIKKSGEINNGIIRNFDVERVIDLAMKQMKNYKEESADNVDRFRKLFAQLKEKDLALTYGVISNTEQLIASAVFFKSRNRAYYILVGNHPESKDSGASHALIDAYIKDHAGMDMVLDFEGSDIPGLAAFYAGFGARKEMYPFLRMNRLPFWLKWMKE